MSLPSEVASAAAVMRQINQAWQTGRLDELASMLHAEIVMAPPGFGGRAQGRDAILAGFRDYCENATTLEFDQHDLQTDVIGDVAIATFRYAWSTSTRARAASPAAAISGCSRSIPARGSACGGRCSTWRSTRSSRRFWSLVECQFPGSRLQIPGVECVGAWTANKSVRGLSGCPRSEASKMPSSEPLRLHSRIVSHGNLVGAATTLAGQLGAVSPALSRRLLAEFNNSSAHHVIVGFLARHGWVNGTR